MKLNTKIWILVVLFGVRGVLYFTEGILGLIEEAPYGEYGDAFVNAGIMGYIAYLIFAKRNKWAYWFALVFTGFALLRFAMGIGLFAYSDISLSVELLMLAILYMVIFGAVPLLLLLNKEIRKSFLQT